MEKTWQLWGEHEVYFTTGNGNPRLFKSSDLGFGVLSPLPGPPQNLAQGCMGYLRAYSKERENDLPNVRSEKDTVAL